MSGILPNFLIIGAQKSGTTSLHHYLQGHPDTFLPRVKELHFFDRNFHRGVDWYESQFSGVKSQHAVGEATPYYMYVEEGMSRIAETLPDAKLIAVLRNPVDRAYSQYWHELARGRESLSFADALHAERERLQTGDALAKRYFSYVDRGRYILQIQRICNYYSREAIHVLLFDDLCNAPLETFQSICRFLDISDAYVPPEIGEAFNTYVPSKFWKLKVASKRFPPLRFIAGRFGGQASGYPPMDPEIRNQLKQTFERDNDALAVWLGRDLTCWQK